MLLDKRDNLSAAVDLAAVPQQDHRSLKMAHEILQECNDLQARDVDGVVFHIKPQVLSLGRNAERANRGDSVMVLAMPQDRCLSPWRPSFTHIWDEQKTAFIEENQMGSKSLCVFLYWAMYGASSKQWLPRFVEELDAPAFGNSTLNLRPKVFEPRPTHIEHRIVFRSIGRSVSPSIGRSSARFVSDRPKEAVSASPSAFPKVDKDGRKSDGGAVLSSPLGDRTDAIESRNLRMLSVFEQQSEKFSLLEAEKWLFAFVFPVVGMCHKVSFPNPYHIS